MHDTVRSEVMPKRSSPGAAAAPAEETPSSARYEPPQLTCVGKLHDLLLMKTTGAVDGNSRRRR
jgi:hypothetical protein